jgi:hypothetical protein
MRLERRDRDLADRYLTATVLRAMLLLKRGPRVIVINTPWHTFD